MITRLRRARTDVATMSALFPNAERIAHLDGLDQPAAEHLLVAALELPDGAARRALEGVGVDGSRLHRAIRAQHQTALHGIGVGVDESAIDRRLPPPVAPRGSYRPSGSLQQLFVGAVTAAKAERRPLDSSDLLLAALDPRYGVLARAFDLLGIDRDHLREAINDQQR